MKAYLGTNSLHVPKAWERPAEWVKYDKPASTEHKLIGLLAVTGDGQDLVAMTITLDAGTGNSYLVDWGDGGAVEEVASGVKAEHSYTYANLSSETELETRGVTIRQALVTVVPKTEGRTFNSVLLDALHSSLSTGNMFNVRWLEVTCVSPSLQTLRISRGANGYSMSLWCEHVEVDAPNLRSIASICHSMFNLRKVRFSDVSKVTTVRSGFYYCISLYEAPRMYLAAATGSGCYGMFQNCLNLYDATKVYFPPALTDFTYTFYNCFVLRELPELYLPNCASLNAAFINCYALQRIPITALKAMVTNGLASAFDGCRSLLEMPEINSAACTTLVNTFRHCYNLGEIRLTTTAGVKDWSSTFYACHHLTTIPSLTMAAATTAENAFYACRALSSSLAANAKVTHSYQYCMLDATAIDAIFTALGTAAVGAGMTINVANNPGSSGCTPGIATAKNWTVTTT